MPLVITSSVRTVDSNGRVWIKTEVERRYVPSQVPQCHVPSQDAALPYTPDSELAELARQLRGY